MLNGVKRWRCVLLLILVTGALAAPSYVISHDTQLSKLVFAVPEGYPDFHASPFFIQLAEKLKRVGLVLEPVEYPTMRALQFVVDGKVDMIAGRENSVVGQTPALVRIPSPLLELNIHVYVLAENATLGPAELCAGYWGLSSDQSELVPLIQGYLGCEGPSNIVWKSNLQERIQMLKAKRFLLMPAPTSYEPLMNARGQAVYRIEPAVVNDFLYAYLHAGHAYDAALINKALAE